MGQQYNPLVSMKDPGISLTHSQEIAPHESRVYRSHLQRPSGHGRRVIIAHGSIPASLSVGFRGDGPWRNHEDVRHDFVNGIFDYGLRHFLGVAFPGNFPGCFRSVRKGHSDLLSDLNNTGTNQGLSTISGISVTCEFEFMNVKDS